MRAPDFWERPPGLICAVLAPASLAYRLAGRIRKMMAKPWRAPIPVVCLGGLVVGGSGKTPATLAVASYLARRGVHAHAIGPGYLGSFARQGTARRIDPERHTVAEAGDEAMLLAKHLPTWVCNDRRESARAAFENGAQIILLDDGFQDPWIEKDLSFLVVDGAYGFGNRKILPAGPLREKVEAGLGRADAVILVGENTSGVTVSIPDSIPLLRSKLVPTAEAEAVAGREVIAFAGIGGPKKFFRTLEELGCRLRSKFTFPDHHAYDAEDLEKLFKLSEQYDVPLVTTEKDAVRLPPDARARVEVVPVTLSVRDEDALERLLEPLLPRA